jgi:hypothetical protein
MKTDPRAAVWVLLSELFVDTEHSDEDLQALGRALQKTGFSVDEVGAMLRREVAPVCGRWMLYPGAIGPWPLFDEQALRAGIEERLRKPWYQPPLFRTGLLLMPGVRRNWGIVRNAMRGKPET